jgi:hypothetical protein
MPGEDADYELVDGAGKLLARIRQEGERWWVARPGCTPQPPLETLDDARRRATSMALMAMPEGVVENRAKNRAIIKAVLLERELYPWRFSDAGERYARGAGDVGEQGRVVATILKAGGEMPDIPEFLRRGTASRSPSDALVEAA